MRIIRNDPWAVSHGPVWVADGGLRYKYRLSKPLRIYLDGKNWPTLPAGKSCGDAEGRVWLRFGQQSFEISDGYASDGCSPKFRFLGRWWGTPDFEETLAASHAHDVLWQYMHLPGFPFDREQADWLFLKLMQHDMFQWSWIYYRTVAIVGGHTYSGGDPDNALWVG